MAEYKYDQKDGKIHTRYSELSRCSVGQIDRVLAERLDGLDRFESDDMGFGTIRHELWAAEGSRTGQTAECFGEQWPATHIEVEFATDILPGVVLHSRPDVVSEPAEAVIDYKTLIADDYISGVIKARRMYEPSKQLPTYALQLGIHGIRIKRAIYLVEIWDRDRENILGYAVIIRELPMSQIAKVVPWVQERVSMLAAALDGRIPA